MKDEEQIHARYNDMKRRVSCNAEHDTAIQNIRFGAAMALGWVLDRESEGPL